MQEADTEEGLINLYNKAKKIDPEAIRKISPNDKKELLEFWKFIMLQEKPRQSLRKFLELMALNMIIKFLQLIWIEKNFMIE